MKINDCLEIRGKKRRKNVQSKKGKEIEVKKMIKTGMKNKIGGNINKENESNI